MKHDLLGRVVAVPSIMGGKPVIRGTRIPVDLLLRLLSQGVTPEELLGDYPQLTREDISAALLYGAETISGEDIADLTLVP
jgi:uncharacterized protein (DUF433 family)